MPVNVKFSIPEKHIGDVKKYMQSGTLQVRVGPSADFEEQARTGRLSFIDNTVDVNTGMIQLKADFPNKDKFLWPGQFVNVSLQLTVQPNAVVVPLRAVQNGDNGLFVFVVKPDMTADMRPVVVDRNTGEETIIAKGIAAGETVVTDGHLKVRPGGKVEIKDNLMAAAPQKEPNGTPDKGEKK
jgi:multidrug efflux system membrane fusion protein